MHAKISHHESARARLLMVALALCFTAIGCAQPEAGGTQSRESAVDSHERALEALANEPEVAQVKVTRQAGAFKRASQEEVRAFLARKNAADPVVPKTAAELDSLVTDASSSDPERRRVGLRTLHDAIRSMPSLEDRRNLGERLRAAQLDALRAAGPSGLEGARP